MSTATLLPANPTWLAYRPGRPLREGERGPMARLIRRDTARSAATRRTLRDTYIGADDGYHYTAPSTLTVLTRAYWSHRPAGSRHARVSRIREVAAERAHKARDYRRLTRDGFLEMGMARVNIYADPLRDSTTARIAAHQRARILLQASLLTCGPMEWSDDYFRAANRQESIGNGEQIR